MGQGFLIKLSIFTIGIAEGAQGARPSIEMPPMKKRRQNLLFPQFQFLLAFLRTKVHAYNILIAIIFIMKTRRPRTTQFNFCLPIQIYNPGETQVFCPKSSNIRPSSNLFYERNAVTIDLYQVSINNNLSKFLLT